MFLKRRVKNFTLIFKRFFQNPLSLFYYPKLLYYYLRGTDHLLPYYNKIKILNPNETLDYIIRNNLSFVRFGTGEAHVAMGMEQNGGHTIQKANFKLMKSMHELFKQRKVLVGIGKIFLEKKDKDNKKDKNYNMFLRNRFFLKKKLKKNRIYGDAFTFRSDFNAKKFLNYINKKKLVIINRDNPEIENLKIGKEKIIIKAPASHAYSKYDEVLNEVKKIIKEKKLSKEETLFLISLGVAAKPLVIDIDKLGYQAWDTGGLFEKSLINKIKDA